MPSETSTAYADQSVEELRRELAEAREQQAATAEILRVISNSPADPQRVFREIAASAARLCDAYDAVIRQVDGEVLRIVAHHGPIATTEMVPLVRGHIQGRAVLDRQTIHVGDLQSQTEYPESSDRARSLGFRAALAVPLIPAGEAIGVIIIRRTEARPFTERQIDLLKTFADQAVIAIENTRLFEAEQASKRELQESLEYQTATSEVLAAISRSPTNVQPVFDTIASSAAKLCNALDAIVLRVDRDMLRIVAHHGYMPTDDVPIHRGTLGGRTVIERRLIHVTDLQTDEVEFPAGSAFAKRFGHRTTLSIPLLCEGKAIGNIQIRRAEARPFTAKQIALVQTFADQAVIAIESARLFDEVQARNRDLTALGEVGRAVSSTLDLKVVLKTIVDRAVHLSGTDAGSLFYYRKQRDRFELGETTGLDEEVVTKFRKLDISASEGGLGEAITKRRPLQIADLTQRPSELLRDAVIEAGFRASLIVPLFSSEGPLGALVLRRRRPGEFSGSIVGLMQSFADQSAIALENARLFEEIAQRSHELEIASQHKSQFVANMSHELRTPLAAILGYAELIQEGFYEPQGPKSLDALTRIRSNGKHLLGLINTVLDIAKIESGQFTLNISEYAIESVVETVRAATESLAQNKKLTLTTSVDKPLPMGLGDEQRLTQVLLNLVGNAIKFTDAGEVSIAAGTRNGQFAVSVTDTGPGIPLDQQTRIFDQFHQVDSSLTKAKSGTGLGLAIAKQIVEMHGGRIWVESTLGKGSMFQMELPTRAQFHEKAP
jgi:signal transduction histidine kinase